jgi:prepilin-type N-terminal cleavage/methylation domain-containing protein
MNREASLTAVPVASRMPRSPRDLRREGGVTLIELLVVVAIIALTLTVAVPVIQATLATYRTKIAATQLAMDIRFARNACVKKKVVYTITINNVTASPNPNTYAISASGIPTISRSLPAGVNIASGSITQIDFQSLGSCATQPSGNTNRNIDITGGSAYRQRLTVSLSGNVSGQVY